MTASRLALPLFALAFLTAACDKSPPPVVQSNRSSKLLAMAGEEAANIPNVMDRFTRQLNIADTQIRTDLKTDAAKTLGLARDTLNIAKKKDFDDFHRIAAWTAISQLSRAAGDRNLALASSDLALAALNDVQPAAERPQYVLSLAAELADLRGNTAAIELLDSAGSWAADIHNADTRRVALIAFTDRLLTYEGYEDARTMLRRDPDPAWRTDTFLALAGGLQSAPTASRYDGNLAQAAAPPAVHLVGGGGDGGFGQAGPSTAPVDERALAQDNFRAAVGNASSYGKDVRFESVYQNR